MDLVWDMLAPLVILAIMSRRPTRRDIYKTHTAQQLKISPPTLFQVYSCSHEFPGTESNTVEVIYKGTIKGEKVIKVLMDLMV